ncbi:MAG: MFS transporter [Candidatus Micrarchaeota archaeon]|nr:MFS transporter [Candidatus Micrarchaeota archaeon]
MQKKGWLNSTVAGAGITSFLSDASHEAVTALLPSFLLSIGAPTYILGVIEGISDGISSFAKVFAGYYSDKTGKRKLIATAGYCATAVFPAIIALASSWQAVLFGRAFGWLGRGIRGPPRDALLAASVEKKDLGKAFGLHRAGDTLGAIIGPVIALALLWGGIFTMRQIFLLALIPAIFALLAFVLLVREEKVVTKKERIGLLSSISKLPDRFKKFSTAVFVFGLADFSHTLLVAFAVARLAPVLGAAEAAAAAVALYTIRNIAYAAASYPFGLAGDRFGKKKMLAAGYAIAVLTYIGFIIAPPDFLIYAILFALAGIFIAAEDSLESAIASELAGKKRMGLGLGLLSTLNGVGDFASSFAIGILWALFDFQAGFMFSATIGICGTLLLISSRNDRPCGEKYKKRHKNRK